MTVNTDVWSLGYKFRSPSKFYQVGQQLMFGDQLFRGKFGFKGLDVPKMRCEWMRST